MQFIDFEVLRLIYLWTATFSVYLETQNKDRTEINEQGRVEIHPRALSGIASVSWVCPGSKLPQANYIGHAPTDLII